jgi:hypothetical protein
MFWLVGACWLQTHLLVSGGWHWWSVVCGTVWTGLNVRVNCLSVDGSFPVCVTFIFSWLYNDDITIERARDSVVGCGTMLQAGRSPVRVPDKVFFFNLRNPSSRTMALGSTQPLTEMNTRNFPGRKKRPARRADNLAAIYEPNVWKCGSINLSQA